MSESLQSQQALVQSGCLKYRSSVILPLAASSSVSAVVLFVEEEHDAVTLVVREERNEPKEGIVAQNGRQVATEAPIIWLPCVESVVFFASLLAEFDSGELAADQVEVECHKGRDDEGEDAGQDVGCHDEVAHFVVEGVWVAQRARDDRVAGRNDQQAGHGAVEKHVHEELVVVKADAIGDPRAVMVHLQDAAIALRAVMTPVRLRLVAPLADTDTTVAFTLD